MCCYLGCTPYHDGSSMDSHISKVYQGVYHSGISRGNCKSGEYCWPDGKCRKGKYSQF